MTKKKRNVPKKTGPDDLQWAPWAVRLTEVQRERLYKLAKDSGVPPSEWVRQVIDRSYAVSHPFDTETEEG